MSSFNLESVLQKLCHYFTGFMQLEDHMISFLDPEKCVEKKRRDRVSLENIGFMQGATSSYFVLKSVSGSQMSC